MQKARRAVAVLALLPFAVGSCAVSWQDTTRKGLRAAAVGADEAVAVAEKTCEEVLHSCIARRENPCQALVKCLAVRQHIIRAAIAAQLAAVAGYVAVDAAEKKKAGEALAEAMKLLGLAKAALEALR